MEEPIQVAKSDLVIGTVLHKYHTFEELKRDIEAYIRFYNNERLQAKLNGHSPMEFRTKAA